MDWGSVLLSKIRLHFCILPLRVLTLNYFCEFYLNLHYREDLLCFLDFNMHTFPHFNILWNSNVFYSCIQPGLKSSFSREICRSFYLKLSQFEGPTSLGSNSPENIFSHFPPLQVETCKFSADPFCGVDLLSFISTPKIHPLVNQLYFQSFSILVNFFFLIVT